MIYKNALSFLLQIICSVLYFSQKESLFCYIIILNSDINQYKKDDNKKYILLFNNDKSEITRYAFLYSYQDYMIQEAISNKHLFHKMTINFSIINNPADIYSQVIDGKNISIDSIDYSISYIPIFVLIIDFISLISFYLYFQKKINKQIK